MPQTQKIHLAHISYLLWFQMAMTSCVPSWLAWEAITRNSCSSNDRLGYSAAPLCQIFVSFLDRRFGLDAHSDCGPAGPGADSP